MSIERVVSVGGEAALALLRLTDASAAVFPPLKAAVGCALHILNMVMKFRSNQNDWAAFGAYVRDVLACLIGSLPDTSEPREILKRNMKNLRDTLDRILGEIHALQKKSAGKRFLSYAKDPDKILALKGELNDALSLFKLGSSLTTGLGVTKMLEGMDLEQHLERVAKKLSDKIDYLVLDTLPYAEGASWDPNRVCLDDTRTALLEEIMNWVNDATIKTAEIFWLTDVAGAGKSAVAHTIAQRCHTQGILASCFFFDREVQGRNRSKMLFSTIARDLATVDMEVAEQICLAIQGDRSLLTASISRQFDKLILRPSARYPDGKPVVIVIDALDGGYDTRLLEILRHEVPKLPSMFRIFLTSRSEEEIAFFLSSPSHIKRRALNIHEQANLNDITSYVRVRLREIAKRKLLGPSWPGQELSHKFVTKADGLFIWASTVSDYLGLSIDPDDQLLWLLADGNQPNIHAQTKIDSLYSAILNTCNWEDEGFVKAYTLLMGAIVAAKTPLSLSTLQVLHPNLRVRDTLGRLGSLLTGWMEENRPIRIIHLSFRDFLTDCDHRQFHIDEMEHNRRLAHLCLVTLNKELYEDMPGTGYIAAMRGIPDSAGSHISETLWYCCRFWIDHVIGVARPDFALVQVLNCFLSTQLVRWIEITTARGRFLKTEEVRRWIQKALPNDPKFFVDAFSPGITSTLHTLSIRLSDSGRREEALQAIEEAVLLYRQLRAARPSEFSADFAEFLITLSNCLASLDRQEEALRAVEEAVTLLRQLSLNHAVPDPHLAGSLNNLSNCLSSVGHKEEAFEAVEEATELYRRLATARPEILPDFAMSLNNLSLCLSDLGRREDALQAVKEAIVLRRKLVENDAAAFNANLATSLINFSDCLSELGSREEALDAIEEAVMLYRQLAEARPAVFSPDLAMSLNNLSNRLSDMGRRNEALKAITEAVSLRWKLAAENPAVFNPNLAASLNNLSNHLSEMDRPREALKAIEEASGLYWQLAAQRPAAFNPKLAGSLNNLSVHLSDLGYQKESLLAIEDAVKLYRQLARDRPAAFNPDLAMSLNNLSNRLSELYRQEEALRAIQEAVSLRRKLAAELPAVFKPSLATSLNNMSICLSDLGRPEEALEVFEQAVELRRELATEHPAVFEFNLATSLYNLSVRLFDLDRKEEALVKIKETVTLFRHLAAEHPAAFKLDIADSLGHLAILLSNLGCEEEAQLVINDAVELRRQVKATESADTAVGV